MYEVVRILISRRSDPVFVAFQDQIIHNITGIGINEVDPYPFDIGYYIIRDLDLSGRGSSLGYCPDAETGAEGNGVVYYLG